MSTPTEALLALIPGSDPLIFEVFDNLRAYDWVLMNPDEFNSLPSAPDHLVLKEKKGRAFVVRVERDDIPSLGVIGR